jgi:hypothetical protein
MSRSFSKVGAIFLLLVLLFGPVLQQHDCFNDAPNLDHDAVLHCVDGLLCIAFTLLVSTCLLLAFLKFRRLAGHLPRRLTVSFASLCPTLPFPPLDTSPPSLLALRI